MAWEKVPFGRAVADVTSVSPRLPRGEYADSGSFPVIDQGADEIAGYTDDLSVVTRIDSPRILFGDHTRRIKLVSTDFVVGADGVKVLRPGPDFDASFLFRYLESVDIPSAGYSRHFKFLKDVTVPLPPLPEQRRIAAVLDQADALRQINRRAVDRLGTLGMSVYDEMFSDLVVESTRLDDLAEVTSGITKGRKMKSDTVREVPYLAVANVQERSLKLDVVKTIAATEAEIERYRLRKGDLLLTEGGDPDKLGRGVVWNEELPEAIHQNHIFRVRVRTDDADPLYLNWHLGGPYGKSYFLRMAKQTTGIASINSTQLKGFPVRLPPIAAQHQFIARISEVQQRVRALQHREHTLDALFSSLQHRAFRGEL